MSDAEISFSDVGSYDLRMDGQAELTRWADATWPRLVRGQRVTVTHGEFSGDFRVVDITPGTGGTETYHLEPAAEVEARSRIARDYALYRDVVTPRWPWPAPGTLGNLF